MKKLISLMIVSLISACASGPTQEQISNADYGQYQLAGECSSLAEERIKRSLKDPSSATFRHRDCYTGYFPKVPLLGLPAQFGYVQTGTVNAKNSYGGYVGERGYQALIKDGRILRWCVSDAKGICIASSN